MRFANELTRRRFLIQSGALLALTATGRARQARFSADPFTLGVASGDPLPDGFVLWTRLALDPLNGGGMAPENVTVDWQVATDERMSRIVKSGRAVATPQLGHSVHVEVSGLEPARWYWYRFRAGDAESAVGRSRTTPRAGSRLDRLTFAFASCQHYETGLYTAYEHMSEEELDLVIHLGDYIYEGFARPGFVRQHQGGEAMTLEGYRNRYAQYKSDPLLQRAHARFPWIVTWDDHEVDNNYAGEIAEDSEDRAEFLARRASAYQAYYEHMPLRRTSLPKGSQMLLYRRVAFGDLAEFNVLDTRQHRTDQPCGDGAKPQCLDSLGERATLLGPAQERWLLDGLDRSRAHWNVLAQQVLMAKVDRQPGPEELYGMDQWSGYEAARNRLLRFLADRRPSNPIVITGDIHSNWVCDLKLDFRRPESPTVGTEFVGTSISSGGDGSDTLPVIEAILQENPHVKFYNSQRGYVRCLVTRERWQSDFRIVPHVTRPGAPVLTRASFVAENGRPGAERI